MANTKPHRDIEDEILLMSHFFKQETCTISCKGFPIDGCEIVMSKSAETNCIAFTVELQSEVWPKDITFKKLGFDSGLQIIANGVTYTIPPRGVTKLSAKSLIPSKVIKGEIKSVQAPFVSPPSQAFYRLILIISSEDLTTIFLGTGYSCGEIHYGLGMMTVEIDNSKFHVYRHKKNKVTYLVIESHQENDFDIFKETCDAILQSIGFLTGNWYAGEHFYFSYNSAGFESPLFFKYKNVGDSVLTQQELINPQQFRNFIKSDPEEYPALTPLLFPEASFADLVKHIMKKPQLERAVELLIDGNEIGSPLIKCSVFSVSLETMVSLIHSENKKFFEPIKRSSELSSLLGQIQSVVNDGKNNFTDIEYESLSKKISYLNTPFNKDKYLLAFKFFNIDLPEIFTSLLNTRNLYFHGKTPYAEGELKSNIRDLHNDADRLHMLVSILILKYVGYRGHIKNHAAYNLANKNYYEDLEVEITDSPFYQI